MSKEKMWSKYKIARQGRRWEKKARDFENKSVEVGGNVHRNKQVKTSDT